MSMNTRKIDIHEAKMLGYLAVRELPSGELAGVFPFIFTVGLCVGLDQSGYRTRFCYPNGASAIAALAEWDGRGDPPGPWIKEKGLVERLNPNRSAVVKP